jgi:hypothetical protein
MKYIIIVCSLVFVLSCANRKEKVNENESNKELLNKTEDTIASPESNRLVGIVHVSETECPLYIEAKLTDRSVNMYPINLDDKFKYEGMKIKFTYELSREADPENCDVEMVVSLSEVALMR